MKIYILTFSFSGNNGAFLQMFALWKYLTDCGNDVEVIDYRPDWLEERKKAEGITLKGLIINYFNERSYRKRSQLASKNISFTTICRNLEDIKRLPTPDYFFSGSDQIWNANVTGGKYDDIYFLNFETSARKVFYAASMGEDNIDKETAHWVSKMTRGAVVSVRESNLGAAIRPFVKNLQVVLDPVFLINDNAFYKLRKPVKDEKYVLIYQMADDDRCYQLARKIADQYGYKIIEYGKLRKRKGVNKTVIGYAADMFLGYLSDAEYVVTNSFHGVALSVKFQKQFYAVRLKNRQSRISSLLEQFELQSRIVDDIDAVKLSEINYIEKRDLVEKAIVQSQLFIKNTLDFDGLIKNISLHSVVKDMCCGCTVCKQICNADAISFEYDNEGFCYPKIDENKCINCGKCRKVCPFENNVIFENSPYPVAYGVINKSDEIVANSSSGGAFSAISDLFINGGGVVYGAILDKNFDVVHERAITVEERDRMRGSKYVQSYTMEVYSRIKEDLDMGYKVLFTGTPCQCTAVRNIFSDSEYKDNLYLCDIFCHFVTSPMLWRNHIQRIERKGKLKEYYFRSKVYGWGVHTEEAVYHNGRKDHFSSISQEHKKLFYSNISARPACFACPFTNIHRPGDITIGDFWGKGMPNRFVGKNGVSAVLINNKKGEKLFEATKDMIQFEKCSIDDVMQRCLMGHNRKPQNREEMWEGYYKYGYNFLADKLGGMSIKGRCKTLVKHILGIHW